MIVVQLCFTKRWRVCEQRDCVGGDISVLGGDRSKAHVCSTRMKLWMADMAGEERLVKGDFGKIKEPVHRGLRANRGH